MHTYEHHSTVAFALPQAFIMLACFTLVHMASAGAGGLCSCPELCAWLRRDMRGNALASSSLQASWDEIASEINAGRLSHRAHPRLLLNLRGGLDVLTPRKVCSSETFLWHVCPASTCTYPSRLGHSDEAVDAQICRATLGDCVLGRQVEKYIFLRPFSHILILAFAKGLGTKVKKRMPADIEYGHR